MLWRGRGISSSIQNISFLDLSITTDAEIIYVKIFLVHERTYE